MLPKVIPLLLLLAATGGAVQSSLADSIHCDREDIQVAITKMDKVTHRMEMVTQDAMDTVQCGVVVTTQDILATVSLAIVTMRVRAKQTASISVVTTTT